MKAEVKNGNLILTLPLNPSPVLSSSRKTFLVASEDKRDAVNIGGKSVRIAVNAYFKADAADEPSKPEVTA